ncbi:MULTISPECIES: galactose oxidase-like domain-containing protein [Lysobacter]|uniref:Galactose oxidase-like domain-containing protein n=1 Tax=Lysobacter firmicutimachus TaxID=1792846 RepID=A0ABU8CXI4_9GAMM|nr:galactose oxidase-like domain-containing protein [Lysobacter antibioticus]
MNAVKEKIRLSTLAVTVSLMGTVPATSFAANALAEDGLSGWRTEAVGKDSGLCIDVDGQRQAVQSYCTGSASQRFQLAGNADGTYSLRQDADTNQCLGVGAGRTDNYAPITKASCGGVLALAQKWKVERPSTGSYVLKAAHSDKCLVVAGASKTSGTKLVQYACNGGANEKFGFNKFVAASNDARYSGAWSAPVDLNMVASSVAVLPNGRVMYWSGSGTHSFHGGTGTYYGYFDPKTDTASHHPLYTDFGLEAFCPALVMGADGRVMIIGGGGKQENRDRVFSYNYETGNWRRESSLTIPRWYNSGVVMGGGEIFTIGGDGDGNPIHANMEKIGEYWLPGQDTNTPWRLLTGTGEPDAYPVGAGNYGQARAQYYRRLALAPDGRILEFGLSPTMRWHTVDGNGTTTVASYRPGDNGQGIDTHAQGAPSAQFSRDKILMAGGAMAFGNENAEEDKGLQQVPARKKSFVIDLNTGTAQRVADMRYPRYQANAVTMPDGQVFVTGGSPKSFLFNNTGAIVAPEMYNPATNTWTTLAPAARPRIYHSVATLLPDGRVWIGGGGQCGTCTVNESAAEIFTPPALLRGLPRPIIAAAPKTVGFGQRFTVSASVQNSQIKRFTLVRMSATTHSINTDQRLLEVDFWAGANGTYELTAPANGNLAPPGYYMLFAISQDGVYSKSSIVKVGA